ncbi:MAG: hypothetical protein OQJ81_09860, partial [Melioribacteraceae bacterium]|nr:hypothetical protein [Melioribacteraceae bacterium]
MWGKKRNLIKEKTIFNSVLSTGDWYRFEAPEEGIFKISRSFLSDLGIDVNNLDPKTIKIYNNGGYILPWGITDGRPSDLVEISL